MSDADVIVYTSAWCGYCRRAKALLERKGVAYSERRVDDDPGLRADMEHLSGRRTVPQIFIRGRHVGGCDELHALERSGELEPLLAGALTPPGAAV